MVALFLCLKGMTGALAPFTYLVNYICMVFCHPANPLVSSYDSFKTDIK
jgi:hypothetical protein